MQPIFFETPADFRRWLAANHKKESELWVGFHKKGSGYPSITWPEAVDEALCFGWIDGVRKALNDTSYVQRFTPRRPGSNWSRVNIAKVAELRANNRMKPAGLAAFETRKAGEAGYSFEQRDDPVLTADAEKRFRSNLKAWRFFESQPPGYRRLATFWVVSAKKQETRDRRLETLIADSEAGRRIGTL